MRVVLDVQGESMLQNHTRKEWEHIKSFLLEIYLRPGVRLDDAIDLMANQHGFHATKMMFKKRLHGWGIRKNIKATEKDTILTHSRLDHHDHNVRRKVLRYVREKQRLEKIRACHSNLNEKSSLWSPQSPTQPIQLTEETEEDSDCQTLTPSASIASTSLANPTYMNSPTGVGIFSRLTISGYTNDRELLVRSLRRCLLFLESGHEDCPFSISQVSKHVTSNVFQREASVQSMFLSFYMGGEALSLGLFHNANSHLKSAGRHLLKCLERPTQQFLIDLLDFIKVFGLGQYNEYTATVYKFLKTTLQEKLGPEHPLAVAVDSIIKHVDDLEWEKAVWESFKDVNCNSHCVCIRLQARSHLGLVLEHHMCLEDAIQTNEQLFQDEVSSLGSAHEATRRTLFRLGRLYLKKNDVHRAIKGHERNLQMIREQPALNPDYTVHLLVYSELARSHEYLGNLGAAMYWHKLAFSESNAVSGGIHEDSIWYLYELVDFLGRHTQVKECQSVLGQIKQDHAESYELLALGLENLNLKRHQYPGENRFRSVFSTRAMPSRCQQAFCSL